VRPESLHVTLKFIGEQPEAEVEKIKRILATLAVVGFDLHLRGFGYFPNAKAARVFWIGVQSDGKLNSLATAVEEGLAELGIPEDEHEFNAHLTLARCSAGPHAGQGSGKSRSVGHAFQRLQENLAGLPMPDFGTMTVREFFLYRSQLSPGGSKYAKLARFALS